MSFEILDKVVISSIMFHLSWKDCLKLYQLNKNINKNIKKYEDYIWKMKYCGNRKDLKGKYKSHFIKIQKGEGNWLLYHISSFFNNNTILASIWDIRKGSRMDYDDNDYLEYPSLFIPGILPPSLTKLYIYETEDFINEKYEKDWSFEKIKLENDMKINTRICNSNFYISFYELTF